MRLNALLFQHINGFYYSLIANIKTDENIERKAEISIFMPTYYHYYSVIVVVIFASSFLNYKTETIFALHFLICNGLWKNVQIMKFYR